MNLVGLRGGIGRLEEDGTVSELDVPHTSIAAFLSDYGGRAGMDRAIACGARDNRELGAADVASVLSRGSTVWGVGLNYLSKQLATGRERPAEPVLFSKAPSAFAGVGSPIFLPEAAPDCVDYEGEIAVIIGKLLHCSSEAEAADGIGGYLAANDVTARDVMRASGNPTIAKSFPSFGQLGSVVGWPEDPAALAAVTVTTSVDGELRQADDGSGMLIPAGELVALLSRYVVLQPGDVVLTGTPAGTGDETGCYLQPGNVVEVRVGDLPPLVTEVRATPTTLPVSIPHIGGLAEEMLS